MSTELTTVEKLSGLRWSISSNVANTVFVQYTFFGSIFVLFLSALGLSRSAMGLVLSFLPFFGLTALFVAPWVARIGYKRAYIIFFAARTVVALCLVFTPWVMNAYGSEATILYVGVVIALFAMVRSVGVTASFPWVQEYVPNSVRGKYTAINNIFTTGVGFLAVSGGSFMLARTTGLAGFMWLIGIGVVFGTISVGLAFKIPGGAPMPPHVEGEEDKSRRDLMTALRDRDFVFYLASVALIIIATVPIGSFLPLFLREEIGLSQSAVVWLQSGTLIGTLLSGYLWGWAADRYGSIPVSLYGMGMRALLPLIWMLMPRDGDTISFGIALFAALLQGVADMGWGIGSGRLLYVRIVPPEKRNDYMAVYYAWIGIIGGISQLSGGFLLDLFENLRFQIWIFHVDPFLPIFLMGLFLPFISFTLLRGVREEKSIGMGEFAGVFLRGNPFLAMSSMIRFHLAKDEHSTVLMTERLARAKSPLTVDELLEALEDPRFNVRFEAIISISRMMPEPRLIQALEKLLVGSELALTVVAAWALGRLGDMQAAPALHHALNSEYRSIRAHAARALGALGALGDATVANDLLARLHTEPDKGLQMAYASALGNLGNTEATNTVLHLLATIGNEGARLELALTLARLVGDEHHFIGLLRTVRSDPATATAQAISSYRRKLGRRVRRGSDQLRLADRCAEAMARNELVRGAHLLTELIRNRSERQFSEHGNLILSECARQLENEAELDDVNHHMEYLILALHTLQVDQRMRS
ncbi:MAG: MFS transporter [Litorilinea sp.]